MGSERKDKIERTRNESREPNFMTYGLPHTSCISEVGGPCRRTFIQSWYTGNISPWSRNTLLSFAFPRSTFDQRWLPLLVPLLLVGDRWLTRCGIAHEGFVCRHFRLRHRRLVHISIQGHIQAFGITPCHGNTSHSIHHCHNHHTDIHPSVYRLCGWIILGIVFRFPWSAAFS